MISFTLLVINNAIIDSICYDAPICELEVLTITMKGDVE